MNDPEDLSRLLDGDLPADEAETLRRRLAREPELAAAFARMQALRADLEALPLDRPPPGLDAAVVERALPAPVRHRRLSVRALVPALALAAGLLVGLSIGGEAAPPVVWLERGSEWVDGEALVHAGDIAVRVDGKTRVTMEPREGVARVGSEEDPMNPLPYLASAVAGAVVTVAVYEGTAVVTREGDPPTVVSAGSRHEVAVAAPTSLSVRAPGTTSEPVAAAETPAAGEPPSDEIGRLRFENALYRGQLARLQGEPQPWPESVPAHLVPEAFEAAVRAGAEASGLGEVVGIDCDEYPCIAFVELPEGSGIETIKPATEALADHVQAGDEGARVLQMLSLDDDHGGMVALAVLPAEESPDDARRVSWRAEGFMEAWNER